MPLLGAFINQNPVYSIYKSSLLGILHVTSHRNKLIESQTQRKRKDQRNFHTDTDIAPDHLV